MYMTYISICPSLPPYPGCNRYPISQQEGDSLAASQEEQQAIKQCGCLLYLLPVHWYTKEFVDIFGNLKYQQTVARHHDLSNNVGIYNTMMSTFVCDGGLDLNENIIDKTMENIMKQTYRGSKSQHSRI